MASIDSVCQCICIRELRRALLEAKRCGVPVELITAAESEETANFTGTIKKVTLGSVEICLTNDLGRTAVFSLCQLIGFVPVASTTRMTT